eukprot:1130360-Amorphochlora_amoeboformis.AAC.1
MLEFGNIGVAVLTETRPTDLISITDRGIHNITFSNREYREMVIICQHIYPASGNRYRKRSV